MATDYLAEKFILEGKLCLTWDADKRDKFSEFQGDASFLGLPVPGESGMKASLDGETRGRPFGPRRPTAPTASALAPVAMAPFRSCHGISLIQGNHAYFLFSISELASNEILGVLRDFSLSPSSNSLLYYRDFSGKSVISSFWLW